jgi:hypothetical protein
MLKIFRVTLGFTIPFLTLVLITTSPINADLNKKELRKLKAAALNCEVVAFRNFMPPDTYTKVLKFEKQIQHLDTIIDSILFKAKEKFGPGVEKTGKGVKIPIAGTDPRWRKIFGPQWEQLVQAHPNETFYFNINAFMKWEQECIIIQRFQACLEDKSFCSEFKMDDSVISISKQDNSWKLIYDLSEDQAKQSDKLKSIIIESAIWADNYLELHKNSPPNDDFKYQFASDYIANMHQLVNELKSK